jgi:Ulp1 protease family, C-terminal catalytic domain
MVNVPLQKNLVDCGIHTIANSQALAQNVDPASRPFTPADAARSRIEIANRLNQAIRAHHQNHDALGIPSSVPAIAPDSILPPPERPATPALKRARSRRFVPAE